ncbi:hypothetical protein AGABI2DRAFT_47524, partial [Agaricus bisporus var. bisporus H97]|uniref:hypothetical protein n=1 Tax=Agaricus bisporus var. bisporus (strain H97 / ATCC MYA-4626 / FGSC 10389) TaxID=936046 RepID=UPI00029F5972
DDKRIRCCLCLEHNALTYKGEWIQQRSLKSHLNSTTHQRSVAVATEILEREHTSAELFNQAMRNTDKVIPLPVPAHPLYQSPTIRPVGLEAESSAETEFWETHDLNSDANLLGKPVEELCIQLEQQLDTELLQWTSWTDIGDEAEEHVMDPAEFDLSNGPEISIEEATIDFLKDDNDDTNAWYPYPSKLIFLLDTIDNLPRLRISGPIMKSILWLLRAVNVKNVPSFAGLRKAQSDLQKEAGVVTYHRRSPKGNMFSFNDPRALIANDWANPLLYPHLHVYPVIPRNGIISEIWHASKWRNEMDPHLLSPMYADGNRHYYIDEPASLKGGRLIVPIRWLENEADRVIYADAWPIDFDEDSIATINDTQLIRICTKNLEKNMLDLMDEDKIPQWSRETTASGHTQRMPNPDRALAEGEPLYTSFIDVFGDDVSGNQSKSWNKHWNIYITHRNLPRKHLQHNYNIRFISTSPTAQVPEQFQSVLEILKSTHDQPVRVRVPNDQYIRFKIRCNCGPGDNPSQSEICGHIGSVGNFPCRKCHVGGSQEEKRTDAVYESFFRPGQPRSQTETLQELEKQIGAACLGVAQTVKDMQSRQGVKDGYTQHWIEKFIHCSREFQKANPEIPTPIIRGTLTNWVNNNMDLVYNSYLLLEDWDISRDTPIELLHTVLLGIVKYLWHATHTTFNAEKKKKYMTRLQAVNRDSLSVESFQASYIMQYANSLIGRQLKILCQVNIFQVYDLVDNEVLALTRAIGELGALLWFPEIQDMKSYLDDIDIAVANVLDLAADIDPSKIIKKIKYHLLVHVREDIARFGPLVGVITEGYESFNSVFRACSILSNHQAPSRDIAYQLARQETVKHLLSGAQWYSQSAREWKPSGTAIRTFVSTNATLKSLYGWPEVEPPLIAGESNLMLHAQQSYPSGRKQYISIKWNETQSSQSINQRSEWSSISWHRGKSMISAYHNKCSIGHWVFANSPIVAGQILTGRIIEILCPVNDKEATLVLVETFELASERHPIFGMPSLFILLPNTCSLTTITQDILFDYNVQHDCYNGKCSASGTEVIRQERTDSGTTRDTIIHSDVQRFIINTHAFHHAHLIRQVLPRSLFKPIPIYDDRGKQH